jgi:hypothetical protein
MEGGIEREVRKREEPQEGFETPGLLRMRFEVL